VEFQDRGFQPEEAREVCKILEENRFDFVELSGGTYEGNHFVHQRDSSKKREAFFMEFADLIVPALKDTKVYVTGGFRSVGGMIDALATVDGVGLGRPLAAEPYLAKNIISGKVTGAIKHVFDESDFLLTNALAGTQMGQIGKDQQPLDASDPATAQAFGKDLGVFMQTLGEDKDMEITGFVKLVNVAVEPFKEE
jgi:2,4-dienoyl-CoA reductase-like NADH-dependent reductase (Old Yellow Enzyme family)